MFKVAFAKQRPQCSKLSKVGQRTPRWFGLEGLFGLGSQLLRFRNNEDDRSGAY